MPFDSDEMIKKLNDRFKKGYTVLSLGGGLQSTTLLLLSLHDELPRIDFALFADTGWEREATYQNVEILREYAMQFDVPIFTVKGYASVRDQALNPEHGNFIQMPIYTKSKRTGSIGQAKRQCTTHFKIRPMRKFLRDNFGHRATFDQWIGISRDEALRQKPSGVKYITNKFPLLENGWDRAKCVKWLTDEGFSIPSKSSCVGCPYRSTETWLSLTEKEMHDAIDLDEKIRDTYKNSVKVIKPKATKEGQIEAFDLAWFDKRNYDPARMVKESELEAYLHNKCVPLAEVVLMPELYPNELFDFENEECTGMCFL